MQNLYLRIQNDNLKLVMRAISSFLNSEIWILDSQFPMEAE